LVLGQYELRGVLRVQESVFEEALALSRERGR
jgi:hypothetical protein